MAQVAFPVTTFTDANDNPLANGYVLIRVSTDVQASSGQLCAGMSVRVELNGSGVMSSVPQVWPNNELSPSGSVYILSAYTADGELVYGPEPVTV